MAFAATLLLALSWTACGYRVETQDLEQLLDDINAGTEDSTNGIPEWIAEQARKVKNTVRCSLSDDDALEEFPDIQAAAAEAIATMEGNGVKQWPESESDAVKAIQHCSWLVSVPEPPARETVSLEGIDPANPGFTVERKEIKDPWMWYWTLVVATVDPSSVAETRGVKQGMEVEKVRGKSTAKMTAERFGELLKADDEAEHEEMILKRADTTYDERRKMAVPQCAKQLAGVCGGSEPRPLTVFTVDNGDQTDRPTHRPRHSTPNSCRRHAGEEAWKHCQSVCASRGEQQKKHDEPQTAETWATLLKESGDAPLSILVPQPLQQLDLPNGAPNPELGFAVALIDGEAFIQTDSEESREQCLYAGMNVAQIGDQKLDSEALLEPDSIEGVWWYEDSYEGPQFTHYRIREFEINYDEERATYVFVQNDGTSKIKEAYLTPPVDNGQQNAWWQGRAICCEGGAWVRVRRQGDALQVRRYTTEGNWFGETFGLEWKPIITATRSEPLRLMQRSAQRKWILRAQPGFKPTLMVGNSSHFGAGPSLMVRPSRSVQVQTKLLSTTWGADAKARGCGEDEVEIALGFANEAEHEAWRSSLAGASESARTSIVFPTIDTRNMFRCEAFAKDSYSEVELETRKSCRDDVKWAGVQVTLSIAAGVTAVVFPPAIGLHGAAAFGAGVGIKSVGTMMKAGAHGVQRFERNGEFNVDAFREEVSIFGALNVVTGGMGHGAVEGVGHLTHAGHHGLHAAPLATGLVADPALDIAAEQAVEKLHDTKEHRTQKQDKAGNSETNSGKCAAFL